MSRLKPVFEYLKGLVKQWYLIAALIVGAIDIFFSPFFDIRIPPWVFLTIFGLAFVAANYQLYNQTQQQARRLQEQHERQLAQAQTKINELQNLQPCLDLSFSDDREAKRLSLKVSQSPEPVDYDSLVRQEAKFLEEAYSNSGKSITKQSEEESEGPGTIIFDAVMRMQDLVRGPLKSKKVYDEDCKRYLREYRRFLLETAIYKGHLARYRTLSFVIHNLGTQRAEDITAIVDFPDEFRFLGEDEEQDLLIIGREPPKAPSVPSLYEPSPIELMSRTPPYIGPGISEALIHSYPGADLGHSNVSGPFIKPKNSTEVSYEIEKLVHNFSEQLDEVGFYVTDNAIGRSFDLPYTLHAANLAQPIGGSLIISIELSEDN